MIIKETLRIRWATAVAVILMLWRAPSWGVTLTWNPNTETDLAGYYIYQCSLQPCAKAAGTATRLATLGKVTSFNVGTPAVIQYYLITAYDFSNNESTESTIATYIPAGTPPPPASASVSLTVVGSPTSGQPWSVQATTSATGTVSMQVWVNGVLDHTEWVSPYCAFGDNGTACTTVLKPYGTYTMEFRVLSNGTEVARQAVVVTASAVSGPAPFAGSTVHSSSDADRSRLADIGTALVRPGNDERRGDRVDASLGQRRPGSHRSGRPLLRLRRQRHRLHHRPEALRNLHDGVSGAE